MYHCMLCMVAVLWFQSNQSSSKPWLQRSKIGMTQRFWIDSADKPSAGCAPISAFVGTSSLVSHMFDHIFTGKFLILESTVVSSSGPEAIVWGPRRAGSKSPTPARTPRTPRWWYLLYGPIAIPKQLQKHLEAQNWVETNTGNTCKGKAQEKFPLHVIVPLMNIIPWRILFSSLGWC